MLNYLHISPQDSLPDRKSAPYRCVLVADEKVNDKKMAEIADWLVKTGCLYFMAWGKQGTLWDDAVDKANLEAFNYEHIPDEKFVMTTWHDNESLYDVFFFALACTNHMAVNLEKTVILHIAKQPNQEQLINLFSQVKDDIANGNISLHH